MAMLNDVLAQKVFHESASPSPRQPCQVCLGAIQAIINARALECAGKDFGVCSEAEVWKVMSIDSGPS